MAETVVSSSNNEDFFDMMAGRSESVLLAGDGEERRQLDLVGEEGFQTLSK